ncbi:hypothetical protein J1605_005184 [Eschrichtius robustus]|uniref:PH domain-containing protein n=1 Tax=Eschrichtius robustus TaxID=9764 RepID=A0AB34HA93_ESCRO|nr:hypothetical protein J1605_005184 [Eschrichtius robustus]
MVAHDEVGGLLPIKRTIRVLDVNNQSFREQEEPSNKRVRPLARVTSLANLISPVRNGAVRRFGQTIQSFTLRGDNRSPASAQKLSSRSTVPAPAKRRSSALWSEMLDVSMKQSLTSREIKRQEKLYIFLFQDILVLTRPVTRNERHSYQVYRQPIPIQELVLEDLQDGDVRMGGSFRGAFSNSDKGQSHTLQANDVFHKQQWFNCIRAAMAPSRQATSPSELQGLPEPHEEYGENCPPASNARAQRRASTASSVTQVEVDGDASESVTPVHTADDAKGMKAPRAQAGLRKARDKAQVGGKRKETLV